MIFISVIIPVYNRAYIVKRAIDSVLSQTYQNFELIIVDDGSTDNLKEILPKDSRLKYIYKENGGVSSARNVGIKEAKGDWIAFLDSDDEWLSYKLEKQVKFIEQNSDIKVVHGEEIWIRNGVRVNQKVKHQKYGGYIYKKALPLCIISPSAVIVERSVFDKVGVFDETLVAAEDYDLWLKITPLYKVGFIDDPLIKKYGGHSDQLSKMWGIDSYRIIALENMVKNGNLERENHIATLKMLVKKLKILIKGYKKHNRMEQVVVFEEKFDKYSEILESFL